MLAHLTAAAVAATVAAQAPPPTEPCPQLQAAMRCGHIDVPLDRRAPTGAMIRIGFSILAHTDGSKPPLEPVFIVLGGPGDRSTSDTGPGTRNFAAVRDRRDTVWLDVRGTGPSAIDCARWQHLTTDSMQEVIDAVGECGRQLGDASDRYGAADVADDIDAVRAALGYDAINLYTVSYGTVEGQAFALRHREHLRALILNGAFSPLDRASSWMTGESNAAAIARDVALVCRRSPSCSRAIDDPAGVFAWLADRLRRAPVAGIDEGKLVRIAAASDFGYTNWGELAAAAVALKRGDSVPLQRLAKTIGPLAEDAGDPSAHSLGDNAATQCVDFDQIWDVRAPLSLRELQYERARLTFGPFSTRAWADNGGFTAYCLQWPEPRDVTPVFTPSARFPDIPALVISAATDTQATVEQGAFVARLFPRGRFVVLRNGGHPPAGFAGCTPQVYTRFLTDLDAGDTSCVYDGDADRPATAAFYRRATDAPEAVSLPGDRSHRAERRLATVVSATVQDALRQTFSRTDENGAGAGLRGGTFTDAFDDDSGVETLALHGLRFAEDVAVDGTVKIADGGALTANLSVPGATLRMSGRWFTGDDPAGPLRVDGTVSGRAIAVLTVGG